MTAKSQPVHAWFWTNDDSDDPYTAGEIIIDYDAECSQDFDGIAFTANGRTFTVSLPDLLEAIADRLRA